MIVKIKGCCPACHNATLFVAEDGYITCSFLDCPSRFAVHNELNSVRPSLTFRQLIHANRTRVERWHSLKDWTPLEWAGAMCGEAGEAANFAKKLRRVEAEITNNDKRMFGLEVPKEQLVDTYRAHIGLEVADATIYGVLLCLRVNVDLENAIKDAFNRKSVEYEFPERL